MKIRAVTVRELIRFVREHRGSYPTVGGRRMFTIIPDGDGVAIFLQNGRYWKTLGPERLKQYVAIFNRHRSLETKPYRSEGQGFFSTSYVLGTVRQLLLGGQGREGLLEEISNEELEILKAPKTEREELRKSRIGQGRFRADVIKLRSGCCLTGLSKTALLRASHWPPFASRGIQPSKVDPLLLSNRLRP
jgi:hypothetical protein